MHDILTPISPGELIDKLTILEIKAERIQDPAKLANVRHELQLLQDTWRKSAHGRAPTSRRRPRRAARAGSVAGTASSRSRYRGPGAKPAAA